MRVFLDMDGVICDFIGDVRKVHPDMEDWAPDEKLWPAVCAIPNFWENMSWMPDGKELWNYLKKFEVIILSAPTRNDLRSPSGKLKWIHDNLGFDTNFIFTRTGKKKLLARPDSILIDDLGGTIKNWNEAGGIGIQHKNAKETIAILENIWMVKNQ
jgi:5'(3')-deoxyribonucleotidase